MEEATTTILELVILLARICLIVTPKSLKNPSFMIIIPSLAVLPLLCDEADLTSADGLLDVVQSTTLPIIDFFKGLRTIAGKWFAIYVLILENAGSIPKVYLASGTGVKSGYIDRLQVHGKGSLPPRFVEKAIEDGHTITHKGLLCWGPLPPLHKAFRTRALFKLIEATFAFYFWAMYSRTKDYAVADALFWDIDQFTYEGLCSQNALAEASQGEDMIEEEAAAKEALRLEKLREDSRKRVAAMPPGTRTAITKQT